REPDWSHDGTRIAFSSDRYGGIYTPWIVDVRTRAVTQVSKSYGVVPCWAPSDREVLFEGKPAGGESERTWWIAAPGGRERPAGSAGADVRDTVIGIVNCGNGRSHGAAAAMSAVRDEDVFPFLPQAISSTDLLYTADGHIKRRQG